MSARPSSTAQAPRQAAAELYAEHVATRQRLAEAALAATGHDALILSSGRPITYFADDQDAPFHATPHFAHWVPLDGPGHVLLVRPGQRPRLVRFAPEDYWFDQSPLGDPFWRDRFDYCEAPDEAAAWTLAAATGRTAYVGDDPERAASSGVARAALNPSELLARLDWDRSFKTAYEVACLDEAERLAARGHVAAKAAFERGASELEIHRVYVEAVGCVDRELPYETIVALDEQGAILHHFGKSDKRGGKVLLIDCGARHLGYGSDITRTWTLESCEPVFRELVGGLERLQQDLCREVRPGRPYLELHRLAHVKIGALLRRLGILRIDGEAAVEQGLTGPFFPHGLGHFLGIQVHDVSGRQKEPSGGTLAPPAEFPYLRTTRAIAEHQVFTIEPGIYFVPMLLRELRAGPKAGLVDWKLVDRLTPCGGARIEDDVLVTAGGHRNLTRPHLP